MSDEKATPNEAVVDAEDDSDRETVRKATLEDLRAELQALRSEMQKIVALLQPEQRPAVPRPGGRTEHVAIIPIEFIEAENVAQVVQKVLPNVRISVLYNENRLVVVASEEEAAQATQLIRKLDQPRPQVQITSYLFEIPVSRLAELGLESDVKAAGALVTQPGKDRELKALVKKISDARGTRLLARANTKAYDRTEASFRSVREIPVQTITQTETASIGTTEFREVGITLEVTPRITAGGGIVMEIRPEYSTMQGYVRDQPIIDRRSTTTTVKTKDGEPILIRGLRSQGQRPTEDSPDELAIAENELLIIVRAKILDDSQDRNDG